MSIVLATCQTQPGLTPADTLLRTELIEPQLFLTTAAAVRLADALESRLVRAAV